MSDGHLPIVIARGERAVCHVVDPSVTAAEIPSLLALYLGGSANRASRLVWLSEEGPRPLVPELPIGEQVPADAEIELELP